MKQSEPIATSFIRKELLYPHGWQISLPARISNPCWAFGRMKSALGYGNCCMVLGGE
jgi:hypothetical protein